MKISIHRLGGFAGLRQSVAEIDTALLPPEKAREMERHLGECGFFELPARVAGPGAGADFFQYEIVVTGEDGRSQKVSFVDDASAGSAPLRRLVDLLSAQ